MFSTFFLCANQTNYTVYSELCTIYIPHTIISALYFSRRETQNFAFAAWAGALSFIAKNVADDLFSVCMMTKAQESCSYSQPMILRFYHSHMNFQSVPISKSNKGKLASACHAAENIYNGTHHSTNTLSFVSTLTLPSTISAFWISGSSNISRMILRCFLL